MIEIISSLERDALTVAYLVHAGQRRKYTGEPYITHPIAVAGILKDCGIVDPEVIAAAILHDTIEDTSIRYADIYTALGKRVADLVLEVTDVSKPEHGNRSVRKAIDRKHIAAASVDGKNIKLADLIHNTASIVQYDPKFAKTYLVEKRFLLEVLTDGNSELFRRAQQQIVRGVS